MGKRSNDKPKRPLKHTEMMMVLFFLIAGLFSLFQLSILAVTFQQDQQEEERQGGGHHDHQQERQLLQEKYGNGHKQLLERQQTERDDSTMLQQRDTTTIDKIQQTRQYRQEDVIAPPYKKNSSSMGFNNNTDRSIKKKKFLLYYSHSGFSNQLLAIERAAKFAFATQRTLVLPPVLPHKTSSSSTSFASSDHIFSSFEPRSAGSKCHVASQYRQFVNFYIPQDIKKAQDQNIPFPSFKEIFDFDDLSQRTGVQFMDMREFVTEYPEYSNHHHKAVWCKGPMEEMKIKFVRNCGPNSTFDELVSFFNKHCGAGGHNGNHNNKDNSDNAVAVLGSAFVMPQPIHNTTYFDSKLQHVFSKSFGNIKLSKKFMTLVKILYEQFPNKEKDDKEEKEEEEENATSYYSAVHIRFDDGMKITNCNTTNVRKLYGTLLDRLEQETVKYGSHVLVADSNAAAFRCFQYHGSDRYKAFRIKDYIMSSNHDDDNNNNNSNSTSIRKIKEMFNKINVQKDTLYLLLDQIMVGLGKEIVFSFHGKKTSHSTFQVQIRRWHEHRKAILAALEAIVLPP